MSTLILGFAEMHGVFSFPGVATTNLMKSPDDGLVVGPEFYSIRRPHGLIHTRKETS
ncbi:MAG: hypothetical protein O6765_01290 [Gammaproteobacteria bacterium]|nr:hypothetical protein [Gammaproteobacteria bacterium]